MSADPLKLRPVILPEGAPRPVSYYSHGIRVGPVLYSAGQTARNAAGKLVGVGNARQQAEQAFHNLSLVLRDGGMSFQDVCRLNIFVRLRADLAVILRVKEQYFQGHRPALTAAVVNSLAFPEYLLEVEAIASLGEVKDQE
jgi:2-iminobutanoate/2-iminopropanoate deaminase